MRFLHLSDIHFTDCDLSPETDIDRAVRERMLEDIQQMHQKRGDIDAILVVGDIAARGKTADYSEAAVFLDRMCVQLGLAPKQVVCVPGNHDVDRDEQLPLHDAARYQLRRVDARAISNTLLSLLRDEAGKRTLLRPLQAYNEFALRYGCEVDPEFLVWKPKVLDFQDRKLHIHGVNSSWVCDRSDSWENDSSKVIAGLFSLHRSHKLLRRSRSRCVTTQHDGCATATS